MGNKQQQIKINGIDILPIGKATEDAILDAASYIDNQRSIANIMDGCKPSYRRLIWSALQYPKGTFQPSVEIVNRMASYHPHSLDSMKFLLGSMVRSGIFLGKGAFGMTSILGDVKEPAALRYTKCCLSDLYYDILQPLLQCVPRVESPVGPEEIPYIPIVFPLCLSFRGLVSGIGYGISTIYPNFSPVSLYNALINDNPNLLEPNVRLILDKSNSELTKLWETGKGKITYSYKLSPYVSEDGKQGFLFEGDTYLFTPNLRKINKYVEQGQVFMADLTDVQGPKLAVCLVNNRGIKLADLEKLCKECCSDSTVYQLNVTDGEKCFRIPLRDWLKYTYNNYVNLLIEVNKMKLQRVELDMAVLKSISPIANYVLNQNPKATDNEISKNTKISKDIVSIVMSKPISYLRNNRDNSLRIKSLKERRKEFLNFNPVQYIEELIKKI